ncbi:MAG: hypothetical protein QJR03_12170 [Sphaerobacter sp.]|nr:hypothetical protein [Sphaerobacter sp.]
MQPQAPLLTIDEFKQAPTAIDLSNLARSGTQADQDAELARVIARASSWIYAYCRQVLVATQDTETHFVRPDRWGRLTVLVNRFPVRSVTAIQWRQSPQSGWQVSDVAKVQVNGRLVTATDAVPGREFGGQPYEIQITYVNGWPNTTLAEAAAAGATSVTVASAFGVSAGDVLHVYDGGSTEDITVASVSGNTLTLASPLMYAHAQGVSVTALDPVVKEAAILVASWMIRQRGLDAWTIEGGTRRQYLQSSDQRDAELARAREMLQPYRVVWMA